MSGRLNRQLRYVGIFATIMVASTFMIHRWHEIFAYIYGMGVGILFVVWAVFIINYLDTKGTS